MADPANNPLPQAITDEAAHWVAASLDDGLSADEKAALHLWLSADLRHVQAYESMKDLWIHMGGVTETPALRASLPPPPRRRLWRERARGSAKCRSRWIGPALAASLALALIGVAEDWPMRLRADEMTATGERRSVQLPDGSTVQLDTRSAVAFDFSRDRRVVRLLSGEAAFTVARDPARPFTVEVGGGSATALGTRFLVRAEDNGASVTVTEHRVRVAYPAAGGPSRVVAEGENLSFGTAGLGKLIKVNGADAMAWTEGMLVFKDAPLDHVVAEIGRYHRGYVGVLGEARALRVSGVFRIDDPVAALDQLQRSLSLRSVRLTDRLILISG